MSDADRGRLRRERERVAKIVSAERERLALAETKRRAEEDLEEEHRRRFGPQQITGPDGVWVDLVVRPTGGARFRREPPSRSGALGLPEEFSRFSLSNVVLLVAIAQAVTRFGFILKINAHGLERRYRRRRVRDEDTAAALFAAAVQAIESGGIAELREWAAR